jgi:hypothetical protein
VDTFGCGAVNTAAIGSVTVTCTATDRAANTKAVTASFLVTVNASKQAVLAEVNAVLATAAWWDRPELSSAAFQLRDSLDPSLWVDGNHVRAGRGDRVFDDEKLAVYYFEQLLSDWRSKVADSTVQGWIDTLATVDRALAQIAIDDARAGGGNATKLSMAATELARGASEDAHGRETYAIDHYKAAWRYAQDALR